MDPLTLFGFCAVTAMLVFYALEERKAIYILCFAGACVLGSVYGFLQGCLAFRNSRSHLGSCCGQTVAAQGRLLDIGYLPSCNPHRPIASPRFSLCWHSASLACLRTSYAIGTTKHN